MSFEIQIKGVDEVLEYLNGIIEKLGSDSFWASILGKLMRDSRRYASSISPVVTGSYAGSHRVVTEGKSAALSIDPSARNSLTHTPVVRYAAAVEERHRVYDRTAAYTYRLVTDDILGDLLQ